ncbi:hypothetical protein [Streptomyces sp. NPDC001787]|uniref:hypothetical protein n=1 Tax=Streptomyces sp. NPDC001787 TaxID=3154523 RepID=UPI00332C5CE0
MSLLELIAVADERALAAGALACLDRCLPPLGGAAEPEPLRPLWASCEDGREWATRLTAARTAPTGEGLADGPAAPLRGLLAAAPSDFAAAPLREWADACSLAALEVHLRHDAYGDREALRRCRTGEENGIGPLVAGELRRQTQILEILAESAGTPGSGAGLRRALDLSTEGRRVLRAVMSRQARGQS